jgi:hypothetical protein
MKLALILLGIVYWAFGTYFMCEFTKKYQGWVSGMDIFMVATLWFLVGPILAFFFKLDEYKF